MATPTPRNPVGTWSNYFRASLSKPLHPFYAQLEPHLPSSGRALELGSGVGHGVLWLLGKGFETTAVDASGEALAWLADRTPESLRARLEIAQCDMRAFPLEPCAYDVVVAGFSLFFLSREDLDRLWQSIRGSLRPRGLFMGQFLGPRDEWAKEYTSHERSDLERMLEGMETLHFEEVERDGKTVQETPKHWHVFHVIARNS
ncbi:MAG TPA: class I SAM-dependent methyltransferase [Fimbriimonas sp.]